MDGGATAGSARFLEGASQKETKEIAKFSELLNKNLLFKHNACLKYGENCTT